MDEHEREQKPIQVVGVVKERVGRPRNDGTPGSGLYAVPLRLSRTPSHAWGEFFEQCWNSPPSFTTMHRPGIASVIGDTVVMDGTTIDEVEKYHLKTVQLCVEQANENEANRLQAERQHKERDDVARREHEAHVGEVANRLRFDDD